MAGGEFTHMTPHRPEKTASDVDESTDLCDTVDWLLRHVPNHNGRVGIYGGSYAGFYTVAGIIDTQPAIRQVQSSWFSLVDRNPQTFVTIPTARPEDFKVATECVVRSQAQPSGVEVYVLPAL
jgi:predicted acyl esterase